MKRLNVADRPLFHRLWRGMFVLLATWGLLACQEPPPAGQVGGAMPELAVHSLAGQAERFHGRQGKLLVVNFWAIWCPPCRAEMPSLQRLANQLGNKGIQVIGIAVEEDPHLVDEFLRSTGVTFPTWLVSQQTVEERLQMFDYPLTLIIDAQGRILARIVGGLDWHHESIAPMLALMAAGEEIPAARLRHTISKARASLMTHMREQS